MDFRNLSIKDFDKNYLDLLEQLTKVNKNTITQTSFSNFVLNLNENHKIIVLEKNHKIVASGTILIEEKLIHGINRVAHIEDVVVDSSQRKKGVGKSLINFLINIAETKNCYKVILNCKVSNVGFYEKCSLVNTGVEMVKYIK